MSPAKPAPFALIQGASWLTPDGEILSVPSFHEEWMREHPELAAGSRNVCELILRTGWISVALFKGGYVELMIPSRNSTAVADLIRNFLAHNAALWSKALVMSMDEEGYVMLEVGDLPERERFLAKLRAPL